MEAFFEHLIKSSFVLFLFLVSYYAFLKRETFFTSNRLYLIGGLLTSFILPFVTITKTIYVTPTPEISAGAFNHQILISTHDNSTLFDWNSFYLFIYLLGASYFTIRLILQLRAVQAIKRKSDIVEEGNLYHVHTKNRISPFSFFRHIFYHPKQFSSSELKTIISHEKVHAGGLHSLDILLTEIIFILLWFNPAVWLYKTLVKQNLEFLADSKTCISPDDKRHYQYLILKQATNKHKISIVNPFFNSIIKKRIVMLNQNRSKKINLVKILIVLPFLAIFLSAFNTQTIYETIKNDNLKIKEVFSNKSIDLLITKNTTNDDLETIKGDLAKNQIDFSYTATRNASGEIIDLELEINGTSTNGTKTFNGSYQSDSEGVIQDVIIRYAPKTNYLYIGIANEAPHLSKKAWKVSNTVTTSSISDVTIEVDKDSKNETFTSDSQFLKDKGIKIRFENIERNSRNEITKIKVLYDNGAGDKGTYQQNKNTPIKPFKILVDFDQESNAQLNIIASDKTNFYTSNIEDYKRIKIVKEGDIQKIFLNGKIVSQEELEEEGEIEKYFSKSLNIISTSDGKSSKSSIDELKIEDERGNEQKIIRLEGDIENETDFVILRKSRSDTNTYKFKELSHIGDETDDNIFIIDSSKSRDFPNNIRIGTEGKRPLYLVDGKPSSAKKVKMMTPETIESINVLKGEWALNKYGGKAKDGVIEITTKKSDSKYKNTQDFKPMLIITPKSTKENTQNQLFPFQGKPFYLVLDNFNSNSDGLVTDLKISYQNKNGIRKVYEQKKKDGIDTVYLDAKFNDKKVSNLSERISEIKLYSLNK